MKDHTQYAEMLAVYAVGALDAAEESELHAHLRSCSECRDELAALRGDAALLALSAVGPAPPQRVRERLLAAIGNERRRHPLQERFVLGTFRPRWLTLAPIAVALVLAIFSLMLWRRDSRLQGRLEQARAELHQAQQRASKAEGLVALLHSSDSMHLTLVRVKTNPQPQIKAVYSPKMGRLLLMASELEPLPQKMAYELWLLPAKGGPPMPCGMFWPNANGDAMMDHSLSEAGIDAKGFAITIEPETGSKAPTGEIRMMSTG